MTYDFKKRKRRRTKHFKKKNPITIRHFAPVLNLVLKTTLFVGTLFIVALVCNKLYIELQTVPYFHVQRMVFKGCVKTNEEELYKISGISDSASMFAIDLKELTNNFTKHPWVKKVSIKKQFPDKLYIGVEERLPIAMVNLDNLYYVDSDGVVFKKIEKGDVTDFPVITGLTDEAAFLNNFMNKKLLFDAIALIAMLKERDNFSDMDISEINLDEKNGITIFTYDSAMPIKVGFSFSHSRFDNLQRVYKELKRKSLNAEYIDIDYDNKVVVKIAANT